MSEHCSICNDYLLQMRWASARADREQFDAVKTLYLQHLAVMHNLGCSQVVETANREQVREAFGRIGE